MRLSVLMCTVILLSPGLRAAPSPRAASAMRAGICVDADRFAAAKAAGFDYVEVNASKIAAMPDEEFGRTAAAAKDLGLSVAAANIFIPGGIKLVGPEVDKARQEEHVTRTLERLKTLGVRVVVLGSGGARRVPDGFSRDEAFAQLVDFCQRLAPIAGRNGITIAVEPLRRQETNILNTAREGLALVKAVDRPEIKLLVDYYHMTEEGEDPGVILEAGKQLAHVHVANPKGRVYPADAAETNYSAFFANLCKIGYAGGVSVEASTKDFAADAPRALSVVRALTSCR